MLVRFRSRKQMDRVTAALRWLRRPGSPAAVIVATEMAKTDSQGLLVSEDSSAAINHSSTSPSNFYRVLYGIDDGLNMDRGGFVQLRFALRDASLCVNRHRSDRTNAACVFDGVTSGGVINLYAAQAFTQFTLRWLAENHWRIRADTIERMARDCLVRATHRSNNPGLLDAKFNAEGGSATGVFVAVERRDDHVILHGAAVGDCIAIHVNRSSGIAFQLNSFVRRGNSARDTGGQLGMCLGLDGNISAFSQPARPTDLVILASDGLLDNMEPDQLCRMVPFIIASDFFDAAPDTYCEPTIISGAPRLPRMEDLEMIAAQAPTHSLNDVTCAQAARRLGNYVAWVTRKVYELEQSYYGQQMQMQELSKRVSDDRPEVEVEMAHMRAELRDMERGKAATTVGKTDDCMVIVITPCSL